MERSRIDVHSHYLGGAVAKMIESGPGFTGGFELGKWTSELALEFMDRHNIETSMLSLPIEPPTAMPDAALARFVRTVNEELAALVSGRPDRFGAFATLPLRTPEGTQAEIAYVLDDLGLDGVCLHSNSAGRYLGQPWSEPLLAELSRRATPTFVHPADCPGIDVLGFGRPSSVIEFPIDTARNIVNAIYSGAFLRNPDLTLILAHAGGVLPTLAWRIAEMAGMNPGPGDDPRITGEHVADVLREQLYYDTAIAGGPHSLLPLLECTGPSHLLFGTDWPAAPEHAVVDADEQFARLRELDEQQKAEVGRNAARLFPRLASTRK